MVEWRLAHNRCLISAYGLQLRRPEGGLLHPPLSSLLPFLPYRSPRLSFHVLVFILRVSLPRTASSCERQFLSVSQGFAASLSNPEGAKSGRKEAAMVSERMRGQNWAIPKSGCSAAPAPPSPAISQTLLLLATGGLSPDSEITTWPVW